VLNKEQVLPLQEVRQAHVKAERMDPDVNPRTGPEVIVGKLGDEHIGVFDGVLVEEAQVPGFLDGAKVDRPDQRIPVTFVLNVR
jgi:hypothetical protein